MALKKVYELSLLAAAVTAAYLILVPGALATAMSWVIWAWFASDYGFRLYRAEDRRHFIGTHRIELLAALPLDLFQPMRLLRLARPLAILMRAARGLRDVLGLRGATLIAIIGLMVVVMGGVVFAWLEPDQAPTVADGIWWSLVTTTTVGYGDLSPTTTEGRLVAGVLMVSGIGLLGAVTGEVAERLTRSANETDGVATGSPELDHVINRLHQWPELSSEERRTLARFLAAMADHDEAQPADSHSHSRFDSDAPAAGLAPTTEDPVAVAAVGTDHDGQPEAEEET